jgi:hypothetical protein
MIPQIHLIPYCQQLRHLKNYPIIMDILCLSTSNFIKNFPGISHNIDSISNNFNIKRSEPEFSQLRISHLEQLITPACARVMVANEFGESELFSGNIFN